MKTLINWILAILLVIAGLCQMGCGTRKSAVDIEKSKDTSKEQSKEQTKEQSTKEETKKNDEVEKTDKTDENLNTKVTELFHENGVLKKRITELSKNKSTDNSYKSKSSLETIKTFQTRTVVKEVEKIMANNRYVKSKDTEQSSKNWSTMVGIVLGVAVIAFFVYKWLRK